MSERKFICKKGWTRHSKGTIINEWEWKRINYETRDLYFEEYFEPEPEAKVPEPEVETEFTSDLTKELETRGIKTKFKSGIKDGKPALDATFTFDEKED